jgi:hypothetical protein
MGINMAIAVNGPKVIDKRVTDINASPPPENPDLDMANSKIEKETIK